MVKPMKVMVKPVTSVSSPTQETSFQSDTNNESSEFVNERVMRDKKVPFSQSTIKRVFSGTGLEMAPTKGRN